MKKIIIDGKEIEISDENYELLKASLVKEDNKRWKPKGGETYWGIIDYGYVDYTFWDGESYDSYHYATKNCYKTEKEAERALEIFNILRECAWDDITKEELEDKDVYKYEIGVEFNIKKLYVDSWHNCWGGSSIIFKSEKNAQVVIDKVGYDDFVKYVMLGGVR